MSIDNRYYDLQITPSGRLEFQSCATKTVGGAEGILHKLHMNQPAGAVASDQETMIVARRIFDGFQAKHNTRFRSFFRNLGIRLGHGGAIRAQERATRITNLYKKTLYQDYEAVVDRCQKSMYLHCFSHEFDINKPIYIYKRYASAWENLFPRDRIPCKRLVEEISSSVKEIELNLPTLVDDKDSWYYWGRGIWADLEHLESMRTEAWTLLHSIDTLQEKNKELISKFDGILELHTLQSKIEKAPYTIRVEFQRIQGQAKIARSALETQREIIERCDDEDIKNRYRGKIDNILTELVKFERRPLPRGTGTRDLKISLEAVKAQFKSSLEQSNLHPSDWKVKLAHADQRYVGLFRPLEEMEKDSKRMRNETLTLMHEISNELNTPNAGLLSAKKTFLQTNLGGVPLAADPKKISFQECSKIFKQACLKWHPDHGGNDEAFKLLNNAWDEFKKTIAGITDYEGAVSQEYLESLDHSASNSQ